MILTDYYKAEHVSTTAFTRYDVTCSTGTYDHFETLLKSRRDGSMFFYYGDRPDRFGGSGRTRTKKAITKGNNISSVYEPDPDMLFGYGDINHTNDACLIIMSGNKQWIEIFISRGGRNNAINLYQLLCDHELDDEIERLRKLARPPKK